MATTQASATHDQHQSPIATQQTPQGRMHGQRQLEQGSGSSPPLHRYLGNSYVQAMTTTPQRPGLQTKLMVNEPGDIYEQEADRVADQVMAAPTHANVRSAPLQNPALLRSIAGAGGCGACQRRPGPGQPGQTAGAGVTAGHGAALRLRIFPGASAYRRGCRTIGARM